VVVTLREKYDMDKLVAKHLMQVLLLVFITRKPHCPSLLFRYYSQA